MSALDTQVGGNHYREGGIQPIQYIEANSLQFLEASVVKRVTRHNRPTGKGRQDIEKAIHELQLLLELRYAAQGGEVSAQGETIIACADFGVPASREFKICAGKSCSVRHNHSSPYCSGCEPDL
jgi:hypothetical protein